MKFAIINSAAMAAARAWSPETFLENPCECLHGEGQHAPFTKALHSKPRVRRTGACSHPGCKCTGYQDQRDAIPSPS